MRAAVLTVDEPSLLVREVPDPTPRPHELVLRVDACGICGSDLHLAQAYKAQYPGVVFGHEFCGEVVAVGSEAEGYRPGDRVIGFPLAGCRRCAACLSGDVAKCPSMTLNGVQRPGGYAEYVAVGALEAFLLPEPVDPDLGALVEPLAVALHALDRTPREAGEPVLVLGAGPVGCAVALWARALGAGEVVVSDPVEGRRRLAESLGAATVDPAKEAVAEEFAGITGSAPRVVIECAGAPGLIQHASEVVGTDGHVTVVGVCLKPDTFSPAVSVAKELSYRFVAYYRRRDFARTIAQLAAGRLAADRLVTDRIGLAELPQRFESLMEPNNDCKVLVHPNR
ncbi:alcohol dehydrogenase catalytic domain-containing protein [Streptacidiphilus sp. ASG 303]|uniref:zinc-dependent alcohol dehydrogenase n=1 Tax=Streptacidiphilus sp. ASG 303 TaxID=2896847 RepID=UPI001E446080|nr:alcohol dehydrogenase catalytic domain-containing protein [Streptacidiphilus sp. ASG 303]MCD0485428.1 alcohol dehydrogenase catalytic domain-containing protein [Streptacidiphilus sp. ASG 303]